MSHTTNNPKSTRPAQTRGNKSRRGRNENTTRGEWTKHQRNFSNSESPSLNESETNHQLRPCFKGDSRGGGPKKKQRGQFKFRRGRPNNVDDSFLNDGSYSSNDHPRSLNQNKTQPKQPSSKKQCSSDQQKPESSLDQNRLPLHAQNPNFVGELLPRFSSILPVSTLLTPDSSPETKPKMLNQPSSVRTQNSHDRNALSAANAGFNTSFFRDGRHVFSQEDSGVAGDGCRSRIDNNEDGSRSRFDNIGDGSRSRFDNGNGSRSRFDNIGDSSRSRFDNIGDGSRSRFDNIGDGSRSRFENNGDGSRSRFDNIGDGSRSRFDNIGDGSRSRFDNIGDGSRSRFDNNGDGSRSHFDNSDNTSIDYDVEDNVSEFGAFASAALKRNRYRSKFSVDQNNKHNSSTQSGNKGTRKYELLNHEVRDKSSALSGSKTERNSDLSALLSFKNVERKEFKKSTANKNIQNTKTPGGSFNNPNKNKMNLMSQQKSCMSKDKEKPNPEQQIPLLRWNFGNSSGEKVLSKTSNQHFEKPSEVPTEMAKEVTNSKVSKEDRLKILQEWGFKGNIQSGSIQRDETKSLATHQHTIKNTPQPKNTTTQTNISSVVSNFFSQVDAFDLKSGKSQSKQSARLGSPQFANKTNPKSIADNKNMAMAFPQCGTSTKRIDSSFDLPRQPESHTNGFINDVKRSDDFLNQTPFHKPKKYEVNENIANPSFNTMNQPSLELMDDPISGTLHFNIRQTASNGGRVQTRASALEKIEAEYGLKLVEHQEKEREREAKKREQFLAKYKHIDQGYKLSEGYLDEAAGFTPVFHESQEEVRRRQQNELMQQALAHQLQQKQINEKKEQEKRSKNLEKNKNINAGYKLGNRSKEIKDNEVPSHEKMANDSFGAPKENNNKLPNSTLDIDMDLAAGVLLDGESLEEALELQEQLLQQAARIREQISRKWPERSNDLYRSNKVDNPNAQHKLIHNTNKSQDPKVLESHQVKSKTLETVNVKGVKPQELIQEYVKAKTKIENENITLPKHNLPTSSSSMLLHAPAKSQNLNFTKEVPTNNQKSLPANFPIKAEAVGSFKPASQVAEAVGSFKPASQVAEGVGSFMPASQVLKSNSPQGPVLVLRKTEEELAKALMRQMAFQDYMDKVGFSPLFKPSVEKTEYVNNGFETGKSTGAIPKQRNLGKHVGNHPKQETAANFTNHPPAVEEPADKLAEMRAAWLKMQQKYEETLRKQQNDQE